MKREVSGGSRTVTAEMLRNLPESVEHYMAFNSNGGPRP